jgi:uncharacterized caspase-like protein
MTRAYIPISKAIPTDTIRSARPQAVVVDTERLRDEVEDSLDANSVSHPALEGEAVAARKTKLFALIIGINKYKYPFPPNLAGAVADANAWVDYLTVKLRVPRDRITTLLNEQATRRNIIKAIQNLGENNEIARDDAILIYFAGHGSQAEAPVGWPAGTTRIQMLLPYNFCPRNTANEEQQGLLDATINELLRGVAESKGNNIVRLEIFA